MRTFLHRASSQAPILLVLEDFFIGRIRTPYSFSSSSRKSLPTIVCWSWPRTRVDEVRAPLAQTLGELARLGVARIALSGLSVRDTHQVIVGITGHRAPPEIVELVHTRTGGNPFFVTEIARLPAVDARAVPENVRAAISQRVSRLSPLANQILIIASVIGREFELRVVAAALPNAGEKRLLRAVDEALQAALIEPLQSRGDDWYHFKHALIRDALYDGTSPGRRAQWHAAILHALEQLHGPSVAAYAAQLATHAARAEVLVGSATLVKYSRMAGEQLVAAHAFGDALPHFERAWRARTAESLDAESAAILFGLGCAQATTALRWNRQEGWANLRRAMGFYLRAGDVSRAVEAATHPSIVPEGATGVFEVVEPILADVALGSTAEGWLQARLGAAAYLIGRCTGGRACRSTARSRSPPGITSRR